MSYFYQTKIKNCQSIKNCKKKTTTTTTKNNGDIKSVPLRSSKAAYKL